MSFEPNGLDDIFYLLNMHFDRGYFVFLLSENIKWISTFKQNNYGKESTINDS